MNKQGEEVKRKWKIISITGDSLKLLREENSGNPDNKELLTILNAENDTTKIINITYTFFKK